MTFERIDERLRDVEATLARVIEQHKEVVGLLRDLTDVDKSQGDLIEQVMQSVELITKMLETYAPAENTIASNPKVRPS